MYYPIAIEPGDETYAFGVAVPDLPGCFSAGDTFEEAMTNVEEAISLWIETALDIGQVIPKPSDILTLRANHPDYESWIWSVVKIDPSILDETIERVNISLPRRVLHHLDACAKKAGENRSSFIAQMALERQSSPG